jgi:putative transposase
MPRAPRLEIPGVPLHVVQRGVNRCATFLCNEDRGFYLHLLEQAFRAETVALHAYVLMNNHVHLLVSANAAGRISRAMQHLNQCYVRAFNAHHGRTGTLWEGRFRSSLVQTDRYLLTVMRYIELNPVRSAVAERAWQHPWSSVHAHLGLRVDARLTPHPVFLAMGATATERAGAYREWLRQGCSDEQAAAIRARLRSQRALGDARFVAMVERTLNLPAGHRLPGRPRRERG